MIRIDGEPTLAATFSPRGHVLGFVIGIALCVLAGIVFITRGPDLWSAVCTSAIMAYLLLVNATKSRPPRVEQFTIRPWPDGGPNETYEFSAMTRGSLGSIVLATPERTLKLAAGRALHVVSVPPNASVSVIAHAKWLPFIAHTATIRIRYV